MKKKLLFGMMAALTLAASCQNDFDYVPTGEETAQVTFNVGAPEMATRAFSDGATATVLQYAVYNAEGNELTDLTVTDAEIHGSTTVNLQLTTGNTYSVIFWAAAENAPYTVDFDAKTMTVDYANAVSNDEKRDAFYAYHEFTVTGSQTETVYLKRPFAQLNIGTSDYDAAEAAGYAPAYSYVKVPVSAELNLVDGTVDTAAEVEFKLASIPANEEFPVADYDYLSMNYLLVAAEKEVVDIEFGYSENNTTVEKSRIVGSVPVQRNHRTNIYGQLLTSDVDVNIEIKPGYDDPALELDELHKAALNGGEVTLSEDVVLTTPLEVVGNMTINLNGKTISNASDYAIENYGSLTINGDSGQISGLGGIRSHGGKITINGGTYTCASLWNGTPATYQHMLKAVDTEVVINGGIFDATIAGTNNAMINVSDGSKVTINGGEFRNVSEGTDIPAFAPYMFTYEGDGKLIINNGEFYGGWRFNGTTATTDIYGGNFTVSYDGQSFHANSTHVLTIYGGTFSLANGGKLNPTNYVADGYTVVETDVDGNKYYSVAPAGNTYENPIVTAEQLKALGNTSVSGTYNLLADIDMEGIDMQPIMLASGANNSLVFNGNGHTIKNLNLVQATQNGMSVAGLFNVMYSGKDITVNDLTIVNATSVSSKYAGVVLAYNSTTTAINFNNVDVDGATIQAETVSPLVSYTTGPVNLTNCDVKNISMTGEKPEKIGAFVGTANQASCVVTANNCTNDSEYKVAGRVINGATMTIDGQNYVTTTDALNQALAEGAETIILPAGEYSADLGDATSRTLTIIGTEGTAVQFENLGGQNSLSLNKFDSLTIRDCKIGRMLTKNWGMLVFGSSYNANGVYTIENCTFDGVGTQGIYINEYTSGATYNIINCTFNGDFGNEGAVTIQNNTDVNHTVNVKGCTFNNVDAGHQIYIIGNYTGWTLNTDATTDVNWSGANPNI